MTDKELHFKVKETAKRYLKIESEMVELLIQMDQRKAYQDLGYASLFQYCVQELKFSESTTSAFIAVSRKAVQVPELKKALIEQTLTISKAAKLTAALDVKCPENNRQVIQFAATHSAASTEQWLREKQGIEAQYKLSLSSQSMEKLKKVRQLAKKELSLEEALNLALDLYIEKNDPLEKAKRSKVKGKSFSDSKMSTETEADISRSARTEINADAVMNISYPMRNEISTDAAANISYPIRTKKIADSVLNISHPRLEDPKKNNDQLKAKMTDRSHSRRRFIPVSIRHHINLRDQNRCTHIDQRGLRCLHGKYLEIHHIRPVRDGGTHHPENLRLLCSVHHQMMHRMM